jgi:hypothetical protein
MGHLQDRNSLQDSYGSRDEAEAYYTAARKRIGLLEPGLIAGQCHMLSGIYQMYLIRPVQAWSSFHQAASTYSLYLKIQAASQPGTCHAISEATRTTRRFEQRLYWSVLKSECEIRVQLDLPQSDLCKMNYPDLFPSPPTPSSPLETASNHNQTPAATTTPASQALSHTSTMLSQDVEQQSWYYYMSEIALRRIENRVLNAFYKRSHSHWLQEHLAAMFSAVDDIEDQLELWYVLNYTCANGLGGPQMANDSAGERHCPK